MYSQQQCTIKQKFTFNGYGIHSGKFTEVTLVPLPENQGIIFRSEGIAKKYEISSVRGDARGTQVVINEDLQIMTVEHLVSALAGLGIDNVLVDVDGPEIPIKDGSAFFFAERISAIGIKVQKSPKKFITLNEKKVLVQGDKAILAIPAEFCRINFLIDFNDQQVRTDVVVFDLFKDDYLEDISYARTFGFVQEIQGLREQGKALGATLENALVVSEKGFSKKLRYPDELARHKIADFLGDIVSAGGVPLADFYVYKSGHAFNQQFAKILI